jgi:ComF family protein
MCRRLPDGLGLIRSAAGINGVGGTLIHLFKYRGWEILAEILALRILSSEWSTARFWNADLLIPVPISRVRRRERGYNQSERLAGELSGLVGLPVGSDLLVRKRWRRSQVGLPHRFRQENVRGAFAVATGAEERIAGRRIMIVDDVITTGATLSACFDVLQSAGVGTVSCVSFGRADVADGY